MAHLQETSMPSFRGRYDQLPKGILKFPQDLEYKEGDASIASRKNNESRYHSMKDFRDQSNEKSCHTELNCKDRIPELRNRQKIKKFSKTKMINPSCDDSLSFSSLSSKSTTSSHRKRSPIKKIDSQKSDMNLQLEIKTRTQEDLKRKSDLYVPSRPTVSFMKSSIERKRWYLRKNSYDCTSFRSSSEERQMKLQSKRYMDYNSIELRSSIDNQSTLSLNSSKSTVTMQIKEIQSGRHRKIAKGVYAAIQILIKSSKSKECYNMAEQELENVLSSFNIVFNKSSIEQSIRAAALVIETARSTKIEGDEIDMDGLSSDLWKELVTAAIYLARNERLQKSFKNKQSSRNETNYIFLKDFETSNTSNQKTMLYAAIDAALIILLEANTVTRFTRKFPLTNQLSPKINLLKSMKLSPTVNCKQRYGLESLEKPINMKQKKIEKCIKPTISKENRENLFSTDTTRPPRKKKIILKTRNTHDLPPERDNLKLYGCGFDKSHLYHGTNGSILNEKFDDVKDYLNISMNRLSTYFGKSKMAKIRKKCATSRACKYLERDTKRPLSASSSQTHTLKPILKKNGISRSFFDRRLSNNKKLEIIKAHMGNQDMLEEIPHFSVTVPRKRHKFDENHLSMEKNNLSSTRKMRQRLDCIMVDQESSNQKFPRASVHRLSSRFLSKIAGDEIEIILLNT